MAQESAFRCAASPLRPLPGAAILLLLGACAGGSGGSGGAGTTTGPATPPPATLPAPPPPVVTPLPADLPLSLTAESARGAFARAFGMSELSVSLSTVALEALTARLASAGVETRVVPCESGGSLTISLADADGSDTLSAGDIVTAAYDACAYPGGRLDGALRIRVAALSDTATEQVRRGSLEVVRFTQVDGPDTLELRGGIRFAFTSTLAADRLEMESDELVATQNGRSEALSGFAYRFTLQQNGSGYDNSATGTLRSETLPGTFSFTQPSTWRAQAGRLPAAGVAAIAGPGGASARLDQFDVSFTEARDGIALLLDLDGNGSFESTQVLPWTDFVDAAYFSPLLRDPRTPRPTAGAPLPVPTTPGTSPLAPPGPLPLFTPSTSVTPATGRSLGLPLAADAGSAVFDARRDRVYLADPFGNRVVVLSAETLLPLETIGVGSSPRGLALASSADELYVALGQGGAVAIVDLDDRSLRRAELESALGTTEISQVAELRPGKLLVSAGNGVLGTVDLDDASRVRVIGGLPPLPRARFEISADRRFGYAMADGSPGRIAKLDLSGAEPLPLFFRDIPGDAIGVLTPAGDRLVIGNGTVVDTSGLTLLERGDLAGSVGRTDDYSRLLLSAMPARLVDGATLGVLQSFNVACNPASGQAGVLSLGSRGAWLLYGPLGQCVFSTETPATPPGLDGPRLLPAPPEPVSRNGRAIQIATSFSERAADLALDDPGGLVYVSLPVVGQVAVVSLAGNAVLARIAVGGDPQRLLLSADRRWLYVALVGTGEVAVIDTTTRLVAARIPLGATLGATLIQDLVEVRPDVIVASGRTEAGALVPLVEARRSAPHDPRRVGAPAGYRRAGLVVSPDRSRLYVVENGGPRVVEARDLAVEGYPLVATSQPRGGFFSGFQAISADGSRLWLGGEVLAAATLTRLGLAGDGRPVLPTPTTGPGAGAFHSASRDIVTAYDSTTFQRVYSARLVCPDSPLILPGMTFAIGFETTGRVVHSASRDELVMLQPSVGALCVAPR
jgi:DNA-binding beta-propeller fold protein YncE